MKTVIKKRALFLLCLLLSSPSYGAKKSIYERIKNIASKGIDIALCTTAVTAACIHKSYEEFPYKYNANGSIATDGHSNYLFKKDYYHTRFLSGAIFITATAALLLKCKWNLESKLEKEIIYPCSPAKEESLATESPKQNQLVEKSKQTFGNFIGLFKKEKAA